MTDKNRIVSMSRVMIQGIFRIDTESAARSNQTFSFARTNSLAYIKTIDERLHGVCTGVQTGPFLHCSHMSKILYLLCDLIIGIL